MLPFLALISMAVTARSQRLGDLAAGTMVVHERKLSAPEVVAPRPPAEASAAAALDTSRLTAHDNTVLRTFLSRRSSLDPSARQQDAARLGERVRAQLGERPGEAPRSDEQLIEAAAEAYRARFAREPD